MGLDLIAVKSTKKYVDETLKGAGALKGDKGDPGYTPVRGIDYWTAEDVAEIQSYIDTQIGGALSDTY